MKPLDIGKLNKRITFLKFDEEHTDEMGQNKPEYVKHKSVWATVKSLRGGEYYEAQKLRPELTYKIITRYVKGVTPDMRISYDGKIFEIDSVNNVDELDIALEIMCTEYIEKVDKDE